MQELTETQQKALRLFDEAASLERQGKIGDALRCYQLAFKLDSAVESLLRQQQQQSNSSQKFPVDADGDQPAAAAPEILFNGASEHITEEPQPIQEITSRLHQSLSIAEMRSKPSPQHPSSSTHFSALPREIVIYVLQLLILDDPISIENFSGCCLAFYRLSRDNSIWKTAYQQSMARMSSQNQTTLFREAAQMESRPLSPADYRQLFLEVARLRFDGAYISQCHYIRQGLSDGSFSQPIHMVTYYRYLRFYADGTALHMLSNHEPALVIYRLRKQSMVSRRGGSGTFKDFRILVGRFQFDGTMRAISITTSDTISGKDQFHLELELRSTHLGGWNKLKWARYYSTRDGEPDHTEYSLRNFRPFMFSRVKSFLHDNVS